MDDKEKAGIGQIGFMQGTVIVYSFSGVFQKLASRYPMISIQFLLFYGCSIGILFVYAVLWQMILRKVPLTTAYSNRAVSMIWSMGMECTAVSREYQLESDPRCDSDLLRDI